MAKHEKKQKRNRRKRKRHMRNKEKAATFIEQPWVAPKMKLFKMPNIFNDDVPWDKRLEIVRSIGNKAKEKFDQKYPQIESWFSNYDPLYLLSYCAFYFVASPEGIDPEASGNLRFYHHCLEILQAFSLVRERVFSLKPLFNDASKLQEEMKEIGELMQFRLMNIPEELTTEDELNAYLLRTDMMGQTAAVRNWAYPYQIKRITLRLAASIKDEFISFYGMDPIDLIQLLFTLADERNYLLNSHMDKLRSFYCADNYKEIINAYNNAFPENIPIEGPAVEDMWVRAGKKKQNLLTMLFTHSGQCQYFCVNR